MKVIIAGMHRSGTSAVTGVLGLCGLDIGSNFSIPTKWNPKGYFEDLDFRQVNRCLFKRSDVRRNGDSFSPPYIADEDKGDRANIKAFLRRWKERDPAGWKDPFSSLVIDVWNRYIQDLRVVICERPQIEIAHSLKARQGMTIKKGIKLASNYKKTISYHLKTNDIPSYRIKYHDLMNGWRDHLPGLCEFLEIDGPKDEPHIDDFIESNLWNQRQGIRK